MPASLFHLPPGVIFARYKLEKSGSWSVISSRGQRLGASFYEIKDKYSYVCSIPGAGAWAVLLRKPQPTQPPLFQ